MIITSVSQCSSSFTENTIVVCSQDPDDVLVMSKPLTSAVQEICAGDR